MAKHNSRESGVREQRSTFGLRLCWRREAEMKAKRDSHFGFSRAKHSSKRSYVNFKRSFGRFLSQWTGQPQMSSRSTIANWQYQLIAFLSLHIAWLSSSKTSRVTIIWRGRSLKISFHISQYFYDIITRHRFPSCTLFMALIHLCDTLWQTKRHKNLVASKLLHHISRGTRSWVSDSSVAVDVERYFSSLKQRLLYWFYRGEGKLQTSTTLQLVLSLKVFVLKVLPWLVIEDYHNENLAWGNFLPRCSISFQFPFLFEEG